MCIRVGSLCSLFVIACLLSATTLVAQQATDTPQFLAAEQQIRADFLAQHPARLTLPKQVPAKAARMWAQKMSEDKRGSFDFSFAIVWAGNAEPAHAKPVNPSAGRQTLDSFLKSLPFGYALSKGIDEAANASDTRVQEARQDRHATENLANYRSLVLRYEIVTPDVFDAGGPAQKVHWIMDAAGKFQNELPSLCPVTVYMLDVSAAGDQATGDDSQSRDNDVVEKTIEMVHGVQSADFKNYPTFCREQKTAALRRAYKKWLDHANNLLAHPDFLTLREYLSRLNLSMTVSSDNFSISDQHDKPISSSQLVLQSFGKAALDAFERQPEGPDKNATRVAAVVMWTYFRVVMTGLMLS